MEACRHTSARHRRALWPYLLTALLALLAAMGALALGGITPFGEGTLSWQDNGQQVASDFGYVREVLQGRSALDWSYACGGSPRSSFHPTFNNLCSPLTWAVAALPGLDALTGLSLLFLLQMTLLPLGALFYLRRTFPRLPVALGMTLALCYAFGGFVLTKYTFLPFLNVALLFPWFVAALDSLLRRGRWLLYCLLLAFMMAAGTCFAYMYGLFAALYAAARTGWRWSSPVRQHSCLLVLASAGAAALSAFSWLPSLLVTASSARAGESHLLWFMTRPEVEPAFLVWGLSIPVALLVLALMVEERVSLRCRGRYERVFIVLLVGLVCTSATSLWHLSRPWDFAGRFSYMAEFMMICCVAQSACRLRCRHWGRNRLLPACVLGGIVLIFAWWMPWETLLVVGGGLVLMCCWKRNYLRAALLICAALCAVSLGIRLQRDAQEYAGRYQSAADRVRLVEWAAKQLPEAEGRAKSLGYAAVENLAFFTPFDSLSHFTACITRDQQQTLARWGYQERVAVISSEGGTLATDTLLGMRYFLSQGRECPEGLPLLALQPAPQGVYRIQENPYWFGMGLMLPPDTFPLAAQNDPITCQQELLGKLLGNEYAGRRGTGRVGEAMQLPPDCLNYLLQPAGEGCRLLYLHGGDSHERWGGVEEPPRLWGLPAGGEIIVQGGEDAGFQLYHLPLSSLERLRDYAGELPVQEVTYARHRLQLGCRSSESRSLLFLPLLWQAGYEATVDGASAPVQNLDGWVGIPMPQPGEHRVELRYNTPGKLAGALISIGTLVLLPVCFLLHRRGCFCSCVLSPQGGLNTLCRRAMLLVSFTLLLWPLLTLPLGLLWH